MKAKTIEEKGEIGMKRIKVFISIICILILCSCKSQVVITADNLSPLIIDAHTTKDLDLKKLNSREKEILQKFLSEQTVENKTVNINENVNFSGESYVDEPNTPGIYNINDIYYIKYSDINWEQIDNDYKASININGHGGILFKSLVPILYYDTYNNLKYRYRYYDKLKYETKLEYYYKSINDNSGLVIVYHLTDNRIDNVSLIYQDLFFYPGLVNNQNNVSNTIQIIIVISIIVFIIVLGTIIYHKYKK